MAREVDGDQPTVLIVDDEPNVPEAYALYLRDDYDIRTADGGETALEAVDDGVDVVLLDRRMPDRTGDEVLTELRERGYDCRVAMVTAVNPDFDIIEMPFDDYLTKPVTEETIVSTVERLVALDAFDDIARERFRLAQKRAALETNTPTSALEDTNEYRRLLDRIDELEAALDESTDAMGSTQFDTAFREFDDDTAGN